MEFSGLPYTAATGAPFGALWTDKQPFLLLELLFRVHVVRAGILPNIIAFQIVIFQQRFFILLFPKYPANILNQLQQKGYLPYFGQFSSGFTFPGHDVFLVRQIFFFEMRLRAYMRKHTAKMCSYHFRETEKLMHCFIANLRPHAKLFWLAPRCKKYRTKYGHSLSVY